MLLLRDTISKARRLFNNTLQNFKTMLSGGYQRLPKTPPFHPFSCGHHSKLHHSFRELESFYDDLDDQWGDDPHEEMKKKKKKTMMTTTVKNIKEPWGQSRLEDSYNGSFMKFAGTGALRGRNHNHSRKQSEEKVDRSIRKDEGGEPSSRSLRLEECSTVTERLKELELMDMSNVDHLLDIEEVLHYYSRITCPFYIDIVNKFFMEMYADVVPPTTTISPVYDISRRRISNW